MTRRRTILLSVVAILTLGSGAAHAAMVGPVRAGAGVHHDPNAPMIQYCVQPHLTLMDIKIIDLSQPICIPPNAPN